MIELSQADKDRITAEETFRQEVRQSLDKRSGITRFFNSPFGLWVLSSLFLTGLISGAHWLYGLADQRVKDQQLREQLAYEITKHCGEFNGDTKGAYNFTDYSLIYWKHLSRIQWHLSRFKDATMEELIWELKALPKDSDKQAAMDAKNTIDQIWMNIGKLRERSTVNLNDAEKRAFDDSLYRMVYGGIIEKVQSNATK
jgi:hypothetical protein